MPRLAPDTLLKRAIEPAVQDRITLADAYGRKGDIADEAIADAERIQALKGKKFRNLDADELEVARLAFIFAEQWDSSLADAQGPGRDGRRSAANARHFREFRLLVWGKTQSEAAIENAVAVNVVEFLDGPRAESPSRSKASPLAS